MPRLLFEKTGNAVWISHLDLMRLFQRGFKRAGLQLKHTQGFSQRPVVSIALPLSVGVESRCELLDFELVGESVPCDRILTELNRTLVDGVKVLAVYDDGRKLRDLTCLDCAVTLEYDASIPDGAEEGLRELFGRDSLIVTKRGKNGPVEQDILPMVKQFELVRQDDFTLMIQARICCQNPTLNPAQFIAAIERYAPQWLPDFSKCSRLEVYDGEESIFR